MIEFSSCKVTCPPTRTLKTSFRLRAGKIISDALVFYSRFVLHSLEEAEEDRFLSALSDCMKQNECVYFEFRVKEDANRQKHYPSHFRRYLDAE